MISWNNGGKKEPKAFLLFLMFPDSQTSSLLVQQVAVTGVGGKKIYVKFTRGKQ